MPCDGKDRAHHSTCQCPECAKLMSLGSFFDYDPNARPSNTCHPQIAARPTGAQINQGHADLRSLMNNPVLYQPWKGFDHSAIVKEALLQGATLPSQHAYPTTLQIDHQATPSSGQQQQRSSILTRYHATSHYYSAQHNSSAGLVANAFANPSMTEGQGLPTTHKASKVNSRNDGNAVDESRFDNDHAATVGNQQQQSTPRKSHTTQRRARRTLTPSTPSQSSDDDDD